MSNKKLLLINIIFVIILLIINLLSLRFLPNRIALQITSSGNLTNYCSKSMFAISLPIMAFLVALYLFFKKEKRVIYFLVVDIIILFCDLAAIFMNIK